MLKTIFGYVHHNRGACFIPIGMDGGEIGATFACVMNAKRTTIPIAASAQKCVWIHPKGLA